jgi:glucokinase
MYIVFDIGGTHIRVAVSSDGETLSKPLTKDTPASFDEGVRVLVALIAEAANGQPIISLGGGVAGIFDPKDQALFYSPNLKGWEGHSIKQALQKEGYNALIENDAALAALGEASYGAGRGGKIVAYYTISTGIGGARIVDGKIDRRSVGFEPGKQIINSAGPSSVETMISGHALQAKYNMKPALILDKEVWKKAADDLAIAAFNSIAHWSPDTFVFGGPMILQKPGIDIDAVRAALEKLLVAFPAHPSVKLAELGTESGLYGALRTIVQIR